MSWESVSRDETETIDVGRRIGSRVHPPIVILLVGELGSGKTVLTRGLVEGLGIQDPALVHSPSFSLVNEYPAVRGLIYHIDLYRLDTLRDQHSIGLDEILASDSIVIVEWADKLLLPVFHPLRIRIETVDASTRRITVEESSVEENR